MSGDPALDLLLPGDPQTLTGGYIYDRRIVRGLGTLGWRVTVHALDHSFPFPTSAALDEARSTLEQLPAGSIVQGIETHDVCCQQGDNTRNHTHHDDDAKL